MENKQESIQQLTEIRNLMERSSRFISLSGLSGVSAGIFALIGATIAFFHLDFDDRFMDINGYLANNLYYKFNQAGLFLSLDALIILTLALSSGIYFTSRKARKKGLKVWDSTAKRLVINLFVPLATGGLFCMVLLYHGIIYLTAPVTLIFYGLALINASKYTLHEVRILGITEVILGLIASLMVGYGLIFWAIGFGVLHIFYGLLMYFRYEAVKNEKVE